jgi:hypothetical protein
MAIRVSVQSCVVIPQAQVVNVRKGRRECWIFVWTPEGVLVTAAGTRPSIGKRTSDKVTKETDVRKQSESGKKPCRSLWFVIGKLAQNQIHRNSVGNSTVVDNQSPPIISAIIDLLFLLPELMRTS